MKKILKALIFLSGVLSQSLEIGKHMNVYLDFVFGDSVRSVKIIPEVDDFSRILIKDSFQKDQDGSFFPSGSGATDCPTLTENDDATTVSSTRFSIRVGTESTFTKTFSMKSCKFNSDSQTTESKEYYFPAVTVVITAEGGEVKSLNYDDSCFSCSSNSAKCLLNAFNTSSLNSLDTFANDEGGPGYDCGVPVSDCQDGTTDCDLSIFFVWRGDDKNGDYFKSNSKRLSRFQEYNLESLSGFLEF